MKERQQLIEHLETYALEQAMGVDVGYHLTQLIELLREQEQEESEEDETP